MTDRRWKFGNTGSRLPAVVLAAAVGIAGITLAVDSVRGADHRDARTAAPKVPLKTPQSFNRIRNKTVRSQKIFAEAGKVLMHSRCMNCHPSGDQPGQGEKGAVHQPVVTRGADGFGAVGMRCQTCHGAENFDPGRVPGVQKWHLAPSSMAWQGKSLGDICRQIKDPARNGGKTIPQIVEHMSHDPLVGWAWNPGADRDPAPGDWQSFAALVKAWADTGAACPK